MQVLQDDKLMINQEPSDWGALGGHLAEIFKDRADKVAFVQGGSDVPYEEVARAIDILRSVGINQVGLLTPQTGPNKSL